MPLAAEHKQYSGVIHGGVVAALADTIAGFAAYGILASTLPSSILVNSIPR
jgi:uncharacterized protein (TIGR00369 family)